jgi:hypothetical protein
VAGEGGRIEGKLERCSEWVSKLGRFSELEGGGVVIVVVVVDEANRHTLGGARKDRLLRDELAWHAHRPMGAGPWQECRSSLPSNSEQARRRVAAHGPEAQ